ncbi:hypothetical protein AKJ64_00865 [candidate division MSBL1 archaeon SCGC-AAA259E17]|uniref:ATP-grasp domain-containing protein n=1 Tax=candidate division MSBL1 archaeon SCGC-AAA259E17 TaxID=1698263 RepID=A0A133UGR9_9EURY|nr:hypothetical protein AKJ64_00865 [candidate division MSBL1 archaeon SCGC-AAA259E17]
MENCNITKFDLNFTKTLLVAGVNTRPIVRSAKNLGLQVIAIDCFEDQYISKHTDALFMTGERSKISKPKEFFHLALEALDSYNPDVVILSSGMENCPEKVEKLGKRIKIAGNKPSQLEICRNERRLFDIADNLEIPHPKTKQIENKDEALENAREIGFPLLIKPSRGGGGIGIKLVENEAELINRWKNLSLDRDRNVSYLQEFINGRNASASVLSTGSRAKCLTVNEQIIGEKKLDVPRRFGYCGNVIPLSEEDNTISKLKEYSESICEELELLGSNGVDFVVKDKPYLVEVNPRLQNTMDLVELSLGINLLEEHFKSFSGEIVESPPLLQCSAKLIVYARKTLKVPDLTSFQDAVDIPKPKSFIKKGMPICSVLKTGHKREKVVEKAYELAKKIQRRVYGSPEPSS